jgi:dTDP-4-dehydrorhamnose 3,5-epimerase
MKSASLAILDVKLLHPVKHGDGRGFFSETYNQKRFHEAGITSDFIQDNHVFSSRKGTLRGLHFQTGPFAQAKLIRVTRGRMFDVAVDIRKGSPTFGQHVVTILSAEEWNQVFIPVGFAHGLCTLEDNTEVIYKVTAPYSPEHDKGLSWNDPALGIEWPIAANEAVISDRDMHWPALADLPAYF